VEAICAASFGKCFEVILLSWQFSFFKVKLGAASDHTALAGFWDASFEGGKKSGASSAGSLSF
jgi:hypothetical protein